MPTLAETIGCALLPFLAIGFFVVRAIIQDRKHDREVDKRVERWDF